MGISTSPSVDQTFLDRVDPTVEGQPVALVLNHGLVRVSDVALAEFKRYTHKLLLL